MKSDEPESDKTVSISQIQPLVFRKLPRVITPIPGKKWQNESDNDGVARATITHSESGTKDRRKARKLVSELAIEAKRGKGKGRRKKAARGPSVDTSRARGSCDVVRLAIRDLGWREVCCLSEFLCFNSLPMIKLKSIFTPLICSSRFRKKNS